MPFDNDDLKRLKERFFAKVNKTYTCWLWIGSKGSNGYGQLFLGTPQDNQTDASSKGRSRGKVSRGEKNMHAKLTEDQVIEMRKAYKPYEVTVKMLCDQYHMSQGAIIKVLRHESWRHVKAAGK
jgi:hypothetical protein